VPLGDLSALMAKSRDEAALREAWLGWHQISPPMRNDYARAVALANTGAREIAFSDVGELWRSGYDMPPESFRQEADRLWGQLKPFYDELHCFVRARLRKQYGPAVVPVKGLIPAHLLGNMWAQTWDNLYSMAEPYPGVASLDVTKRLEQKKFDERKLVKHAEGFYTSLGLDPLPATFWERSLFVKPADRDVECHASAWDVSYSDDLRIKMCIKMTEEDFATVHHELGHNYYQHYYLGQPFLFQGAANDGFHEAIGDTIALSITPGYLERVGLFDRVPPNPKATTNYLMKMALDKVAFLPFGRLIDQWRWEVFSGRITPEAYNQGWWELRRRYQGVAPPVTRSEADFDPGAKYHIPASVPYMRYFIGFIYQFQLHRALCRAIGHKGPLHECSIYGSREAGTKLRALLEMGASKPWPEALGAISGERAADPGALLEYFAPLRTWLREQNKSEVCGW
jgi:peptidyl-dipeptidase A